MAHDPQSKDAETAKKYTMEALDKLRLVTPSKDPADFKPGLYQHYTGDLYRALMLVNHHETREHMVVYVSLKHGSSNVREYATEGKDSWTDVVNVGDSDDPGEYQPVARFTFLRPAY